jgi:inorganic pyrophosphatase
MNLTQNILKEYTEYFDGELIHKKDRRNVHLPLGSKLGYIHNGYKVVRFFGKKYGLHQLIYLYHYGFIPAGIDHFDGDTLNNRIKNLRPANKSQNAANQKIIKESRSGLKGVRVKKDGRICAVIGFRGARYFLGDFKSTEEAHKAYLKKASELFGEYARQPID